MRSISARAISGFVRATRYSIGTPVRLKRTGSLVQFSGRKSRKATITGTSPRASVSETSTAIRVLPQRRSILRSDTDRMLAFLGHRGVVDYQYRIAAADKPIRLNEQFSLQRRRIPDTTSNKMVQLIIVVRRKTFRHWLNALAIVAPDQPCDVKRTHPLPPLVPQAFQKRVEPASKLGFPIPRRSHHGRPSTSRPPMNH